MAKSVTIDSGWTKPATASWRRPALREVQIGPRILPGVGFVIRGSIADKAGLEADDLIVAVNGKPIFNLEEIVPFLKENAGGKVITLTVNRKGQTLPIELPVPPATAANPNAPMDLGIDWGRVVFSHPTPWSQVKDAATSIFPDGRRAALAEIGRQGGPFQRSGRDHAAVLSGL